MSLIYNATFDSQTRILSLLDKAGNVISSCEVPSKELVDDITKPLTFRATQDGSTVKLTKMNSPSGAFQTSRDGGNTWTDYSIGTAITLNTGDEVSFRAKSDRSEWQTFAEYFYFMMTGKIEAWHNVMSMIRTNDFATYNPTSGNYLFNRLFNNCTSLTKAPALPSTTLTQCCYYSMFGGCTSLTEAPVLPATTLAGCCYESMFEGCTSLTKAPALPATTLYTSCYESMFEGCTSLTKAPALPETTLASYCYVNMFSGCSSLNEVRCQMSSSYSSSDILTETNCWLEGVSSTGTFYTNEDAKWTSGSISGIPTGWTRVNERAKDDLTKPLTFRATQDGSTVKLTKVELNTSVSFYVSFETSTDGGNTWTDYTPDSAIHLNTGDEVSFRASYDRTTPQSQQNAYKYTRFTMTGKIEAWHNVMSLYSTNDFATYIPRASHWFYQLFGDCASLTKAPALPATSLNNYCYSTMFAGCTSLKEAPELPATTLAERCYQEMFSGCQSLKEVRISATTTTATDALNKWLNGVSATGDFYCDPNATIFPSGASGIPANWTRRNLADYPN